MDKLSDVLVTVIERTIDGTLMLKSINISRRYIESRRFRHVRF
jgi:hypothetical protein